MKSNGHLLFIDTRETPATQAAAAASILPNGHSVVQKLDCADFMLLDTDGHTVGIERKTLTDLLGSLTDKQADGRYRLQSQLERMSIAYTYSLLVIEGPGLIMSRPGTTVRGQDYREYPTKGGKIMRGSVETGRHHGSVQMQLAALQRDYPLTVLWVHGKTEFCDLIRVIYARTEKGCYNGRSTHVSAGGRSPSASTDD